jgi:hypothetical protein
MGLIKAVEGWTGALDFMLDADGSPEDLTGMAIVLIMTHQDGTAFSIQGSVAPVLPQTGTDKGKARFSPHADDLLPVAIKDVTASLKVSDAAGSLTYFERRGRFRVTDGGGKVVYFPSGEPDIWRIYKP